MKKIALLVLYLSCACITLLAKGRSDSALLRLPLELNNRLPAQKATSFQPRIIAYSYRQEGAMMDTSSFYYSNGRGSYFTDNYNNMRILGMSSYPTNNARIKVDSCVSNSINRVTGLWENEFHFICQYNSQNAIVYTESISPNNAIHSYTAAKGAYTSGNLVRVDNYDTAGSGILTLISTDYKFYDEANNLVKDSNYIYSPAGPGLVHYKFYDAQNRLYMDSIYSFSTTPQDYYSPAPVNKISYYYSTNLDSQFTYMWTLSGWKAYYSNWFEYNSLNLRTKSRQISDFSQRYLYTDSITYTGSIPNYRFTASYYSDSVSSPWKGTNANFYHFKADGNWDTLYYYRWVSWPGSFEPTEKDYFYYNSYGLIDSVLGKLYSESTGKYADTTFDKSIYYYQLYDTLEGVRQVHDLFVYPNPSHGIFNIIWSDAPIDKPVTVNVFNMLGQRVFSNTSTWGMGYREVNLNSVATGVYILVLYDENGHTVLKQKLLKE